MSCNTSCVCGVSGVLDTLKSWRPWSFATEDEREVVNGHHGQVDGVRIARAYPSWRFRSPCKSHGQEAWRCWMSRLFLDISVCALLVSRHSTHGTMAAAVSRENWIPCHGWHIWCWSCSFFPSPRSSPLPRPQLSKCPPWINLNILATRKAPKKQQWRNGR